MPRQLCYLIGSPGVGKSALMAALVQGRRRRVRTRPFAHTVYEDGLVQLGRERAKFSGTDALSMSVQPQVLTMLQVGAWSRVVGEGDRLANGKFFDAVRAAGYQLEVVLLLAPEEVLEQRRRERGSSQDPKWLAGRRTKVDNLARVYTTKALDASAPIPYLVTQLVTTYPWLTNGET